MPTSYGLLGIPEIRASTWNLLHPTLSYISPILPIPSHPLFSPLTADFCFQEMCIWKHWCGRGLLCAHQTISSPGHSVNLHFPAHLLLGGALSVALEEVIHVTPELTWKAPCSIQCSPSLPCLLQLADARANLY